MSAPLAVVALSLIVSFLIYKYIVFPLYLSPLSRIPPAHWSAPISGVWILYVRFKSRNNATTYAAHRRLGPIVRLAPNELSINCVDGGIKTVYPSFEKHAWYPNLFPSYGVINMFSTVGHKEHSMKKRLLSNIYSKSYLQSSRQLEINSKALLTDGLLPLIQRRADDDEAVDVHKMNNKFTMDFMSAYLFGLGNGAGFMQDGKNATTLLSLYHIRKDYEFYSQETPLLKKWSRILGFPVVPRCVDEANDELENWGLGMCNKAHKWTADQPACGEPVVYRQFRSGLQRLKDKGEDPDEDIELEVASEMLDHLGAGHETSAIALTYLFWEMSRHGDLQRQLREEVLSLTPPIIWPWQGATLDFELPSPKVIDALPLLHAIVMETLRLHAPIPGIEPRITPAGGCSLAGYANIPAGVRVSAMPYTLHRNASVFPDPESWKPERWLIPADSEQMKEMLRWFWAFGSGGRMCIGSHLATQEIKLLLAAVYSNWTTEIVDDTDIEEIDAYTTKPKRNALDLRFAHI